jgi:hypothetical protein
MKPEDRAMQGIHQQGNEANATRRAVDAEFRSKHDVESERLQKQNALIKLAMDGNLVRVPIPRDDPVRILDSGTGNGSWIFDVAKDFPNASFVGADVDAGAFPSPDEVPPRITFKTQSILECWPEKDREAYDLVHQRLVLALFDAATSKGAVEGLFGLVKPGGYIQLFESDLLSFDRDGHRGMTMFMEFVDKAFPMAKLNHRPGKYLREWLESAGATDIECKEITYGIGAQADTESLREETTQHVISMIEKIESITSRESSDSCLLDHCLTSVSNAYQRCSRLLVYK